MSGSNFIDYVKIYYKSGRGGRGSTHLLRNRMTSKGGPDGGDGGRGGHVIVKGNAQMWTLLPLKYQKHIKNSKIKIKKYIFSKIDFYCTKLISPEPPEFEKKSARRLKTSKTFKFY